MRQFRASDDDESPRERLWREAIDNAIIVSESRPPLPDRRGSAKRPVGPFSILRGKLADWSRRDAVLNLGYKAHLRNNLTYLQVFLADYRESCPVFAAANVTGALSIWGVMRRRMAFRANSALFVVALALDSALVPEARSWAVDAVDALIELTTLPAANVVVPIRPTS